MLVEFLTEVAVLVAVFPVLEIILKTGKLPLSLVMKSAGISVA
jgi:hypothetical protein